MRTHSAYGLHCQYTMKKVFRQIQREKEQTESKIDYFCPIVPFSSAGDIVGSQSTKRLAGLFLRDLYVLLSISNLSPRRFPASLFAWFYQLSTHRYVNSTAVTYGLRTECYLCDFSKEGPTGNIHEKSGRIVNMIRIPYVTLVEYPQPEIPTC